MRPSPETKLAAGLASLGMDPAEAAEYAASKSVPAAPMLTAADAVASAFGHQARVAQMTEALVAARPILVGLQHETDHQVTRVLALIDAALAASPVQQVRYGRWMITYDPKPIPYRRNDWDFVHDEYDGPEDRRCGTAASIAQAMAEIDEIEEEARS
jgi:hypothetical protein